MHAMPEMSAVSNYYLLLGVVLEYCIKMFKH